MTRLLPAELSAYLEALVPKRSPELEAMEVDGDITTQLIINELSVNEILMDDSTNWVGGKILVVVPTGCTDELACNYDPNAGEDDGSCEYEVDCAGECGGSAVEDECGECNGNGPENGYNCDGDMIDCEGEPFNAIINNQPFAQVSYANTFPDTTTWCRQYNLISNANTEFNVSNISVGDFIYVQVETVNDSLDDYDSSSGYITNINSSDSFTTIQTSPYSTSDCSSVDYFITHPQTNITMMEILKWFGREEYLQGQN